MLLLSGKQSWQIRIGCVDTKIQIPELLMMAMRSVGGEDYYFISMETYSRSTKSKKVSAVEEALLFCFPLLFLLMYSV